MTAVLPGDLEQRQAFSAGERRAAPTSLEMLGGLGSCGAWRPLLMQCLHRARPRFCSPGVVTGIAHAGAGKDAVPC